MTHDNILVSPTACPKLGTINLGFRPSDLGDTETAAAFDPRKKCVRHFSSCALRSSWFQPVSRMLTFLSHVPAFTIFTLKKYLRPIRFPSSPLHGHINGHIRTDNVINKTDLNSSSKGTWTCNPQKQFLKWTDNLPGQSVPLGSFLRCLSCLLFKSLHSSNHSPSLPFCRDYIHHKPNRPLTPDKHSVALNQVGAVAQLDRAPQSRAHKARVPSRMR
jgi:hypothetical protein